MESACGCYHGYMYAVFTNSYEIWMGQDKAGIISVSVSRQEMKILGSTSHVTNPLELDSGQADVLHLATSSVDNQSMWSYVYPGMQSFVCYHDNHNCRSLRVIYIPTIQSVNNYHKYFQCKLKLIMFFFLTTSLLIFLVVEVG